MTFKLLSWDVLNLPRHPLRKPVADLSNSDERLAPPTHTLEPEFAVLTSNSQTPVRPPKETSSSGAILPWRHLRNKVINRNTLLRRELLQLPPRPIHWDQPAPINHPIKQQQLFGNIGTTVYSALIREIAKKGKEARFVKVDRGEFALNDGKPAAKNAPGKKAKAEADAAETAAK